ncbi:protein TolR [Ectothiorhodospiraceae bacterium WFHF3C12]|nr:protein TolR [Ectothiorhodospiraceae bacterium WFHF3C12]
MAEINVVPYIDVMLVLLVIFMVTAPLLYQGAEVTLPQASAEPLPQENLEPLIVEIDAEGNYYLSIGESPEKPLAPKELLVKVAAVMRQKPETPVLVRGDKDVPYGRVVTIMASLKKAGVPKVGLMTQPVEG